jgi:uncharacterized tellurite resistance protein B-like protein
MNVEKLTPFHLINFLYIGFAHLTDGKITDEEYAEIQKSSAKWFKVDYNNISVFNQILEETTQWYNGIESDNAKYQTLLEVSEQLAQIKELDEESRKELLSNLRDIAVADGRFGENEKRMHDVIGKNLGVNIMTSDNQDISRKIGF